MKLLILLSLLVLTACAGVHASAPLTVDCAPTIAQLGDDGRSPSAKLQYGPCTVHGADNGPARSEDSYTLRTAMSVCSAQSWLGTPTGSREEVGLEWLAFAPDGSYLFSVPNQYDKHQDVVGSHWSNVTDLRNHGACAHLPPGTRLVIQQALGVADAGKDCPNTCGSHTILYLTGAE